MINTFVRLIYIEMESGVYLSHDDKICSSNRFCNLLLSVCRFSPIRCFSLIALNLKTFQTDMASSPLGTDRGVALKEINDHEFCIDVPDMQRRRNSLSSFVESYAFRLFLLNAAGVLKPKRKLQDTKGIITANDLNGFCFEAFGDSEFAIGLEAASLVETRASKKNNTE